MEPKEKNSFELKKKEEKRKEKETLSRLSVKSLTVAWYSNTRSGVNTQRKSQQGVEYQERCKYSRKSR
ncbi:hypothetical protein LR48_Vigan09g069400 [Vigna angularis]|uniref:Uncharacterized protein n=1 Tax=Phaseolus angularis TaxID=3914 RepID=A0A0L9VAE4_PHAAN|nr:hypothetical protein LR48_Vigan09g069400 [Vigna angularis]